MKTTISILCFFIVTCLYGQYTYKNEVELMKNIADKSISSKLGSEFFDYNIRFDSANSNIFSNINLYNWNDTIKQGEELDYCMLNYQIFIGDNRNVGRIEFVILKENIIDWSSLQGLKFNKKLSLNEEDLILIMKENKQGRLRKNTMVSLQIVTDDYGDSTLELFISNRFKYKETKKGSTKYLSQVYEGIVVNPWTKQFIRMDSKTDKVKIYDKLK